MSFPRLQRLLTLTLFVSGPALGAPDLCAAKPEIVKRIASASSVPVPDSASFDQIVAPFRSLRDQFPTDLFAQIRYQDSVKDHGIEGHIQALVDEYLKLRDDHPGDSFYVYLYGRALEGRSTPQAIVSMEEVLRVDSTFALAHQTLAGIYESASFRDRKRAALERARFHAACPGGLIPRHPSATPPRSTLLAQAERLLEKGPVEHDLPVIVYKGLQQDEWRLQRIRPVDWYTAEYKRSAAREMQSEHWRGWRILVRYYWKTEQEDKANALLSEMQERLLRLSREKDADLFWVGAVGLLDLYAKRNRPDKIRDTLAQLERSAAEKPNRKQAAQLSRLRAKFLPRGRSPLASNR
jgi:hypothetical protein